MYILKSRSDFIWIPTINVFWILANYRMTTVYEPTLDASAETKMKMAINEILEYCHACEIEGVEAHIAGFLPSKKGARIMFKNVYELSTEDVKVWENIARDSGATCCDIKMDMASGNLFMNIDYKQTCCRSTKSWIVQAALIIAAYGVWAQLHLINPQRYPVLW